MFLLICGSVITYGLSTGMEPMSMILVALSASALIWLWGAIEGLMILTGQMPHDGHGHPLR